MDFPDLFRIDDSMILPPGASDTPIRRGPNILPLPLAPALENALDLPIILKLGDNVTTDDIMPAGSKILPLRSNIPAISEYVFHKIDAQFATKAKVLKQSIIVAGHNYGQGSSREHAALAPMYLGLRVVLTQSFARIHRANLINFGILPLTFLNEEDLTRLHSGDSLHLLNLHQAILAPIPFAITLNNDSEPIWVKHDLTERQAKILLAGGLLNATKALI